MRRTLCSCLLALLATTAPAAADAGAPAKVRLSACHSALAQADRSASFSGDIRAIPGAARLQVKFVLQARTEDERGWRTVAAPGFGAWNASAPGISRYVYTKTVENLVAPGSYRALVHFRWLSGTGQTLLRTKRVTRVCRQADLRAHLLPDGVARSAGGYTVTVLNAGRSAAEGFLVTIEVGGRIHELGYVERLEGRGRVRVTGAAPDCRPGEMVTLRVDALDAVDEVEEHANGMAVTCPPPARP